MRVRWELQAATIRQLGQGKRAVAAANQPLMSVSSTPGVTAAINAIYGLTVSNVVNDPTPGAPSAGGLEGSGFSNTGALRSISGLNVYAGLINLGGRTALAYPTTTGSLGADADARPGHNTPDASYLAFDHSLTVTGLIKDWLAPTGGESRG